MRGLADIAAGKFALSKVVIRHRIGFVPAGEASKLISLRNFQSLFHQEAASASAGTSADATASNLTDPFIDIIP